MINFSNCDDITKYGFWMKKGMKMDFNPTTKSLSRMSLGRRIWSCFFNKELHKIDKKILQSITLELKRKFEKNALQITLEERKHITGIVEFAEKTLKNKRFCKYSLDEAAALERWLLGVRNKHFKSCSQHYTMQKNLRYFHKDIKQRDPSLFNVPQLFAEANPDFVDFALNNSLYRAAERTGNKLRGSYRVDGEPTFHFAKVVKQAGQWVTKTETSVSWHELKSRLMSEGALILNGNINPSHPDHRDYVMLKYQMTQWGLLNQHNYQWEELKPFAKITNPSGTPCFQVISYHPDKKIIPSLIGDQGHSGMIFVDSKGFVFCMGFFCHPDGNFFAAFKAQRSVLRTPDVYESRVGANWQQLVHGKHKNTHQVKWNDGALQFNLEDDPINGIPCIESLMSSWRKAWRAGSIKDSSALQTTYCNLSKALKQNSSFQKIENLRAELFIQMKTQGLSTGSWSKEKKFEALIKRANLLQKKTNEANETGNWKAGTLPYMMAEQNCSHVSRYYFGQWVQVNLRGLKTREVLNTRPTENENSPYHPCINKNIFSRWKWACIALQTVASSKIMRVFALVPFVATKKFGRGIGEGRITPRTSFFSAIRNFASSAVTPQQIREEAMDVQHPGKSIVRWFVSKFHKPSGLLPIYY